MNGKHQLTKAGLAELEKEYDQLVNVDRVRNIEDLKDARAQGDLSENADYDAAREEQAKIEGRIKEIEAIFKNYVLIDENVSGKSQNNLGKTITVYFEDTEETNDYTIVGSLESDPLNGKISNESIIGYNLLKANVGDRILIKTESETFYIVVKNIK